MIPRLPESEIRYQLENRIGNGFHMILKKGDKMEPRETACQLRPMSPGARACILENVHAEPDQWLGNLLLIKQRNIGHIVQAMVENDLTAGKGFEVVGCQ